MRVVHSLRPVRGFRVLACEACARARAREPSSPSRCDVERPTKLLLSPQTILGSCVQRRALNCSSRLLTRGRKLLLRARSQELAGTCMLQEEALRRWNGDGLDRLC